MAKNPKNHIPRIAESIEFVATNGPMTDDISLIPNKSFPNNRFDIVETESEVAITLRYVVLHATQIRGDTSLARGISKSLRNNGSVHAHADGNALSNIDKNGKSALEIPLGDMKDVIEKAKSQGKTVRLCMPKNGVPVFFGDDGNEHYNAWQKKKKR